MAKKGTSPYPPPPQKKKECGIMNTCKMMWGEGRGREENQMRDCTATKYFIPSFFGEGGGEGGGNFSLACQNSRRCVDPTNIGIARGTLTLCGDTTGVVSDGVDIWVDLRSAYH